MKIAVPGGTGYVGAHTTLALLADGHTVRLLVFPTETPDALLAAAGAEAARIEPVVGGMQMIDVRDVAAVHTAAMHPGRGPRRYVCGGELVEFNQLIDVLEHSSGRRIRRIPLSGSAFRMIGRIADVIGRFTPLSPGLGYEAAWLLTSATPTDDSRTRDELGITWRPARAALAATFA